MSVEAPALGPTEEPRRRVGPDRRHLGAGAAGLAAVLVVLAAFLPWTTGPDADQVVRGLAIDGRGRGEVGSRAGWAGGDGFLLVGAGLLAAWVAVMTLAGRARGGHRAVLVGATVLVTAWSVVGASEVGRVDAPDGTALDVSVGAGCPVAIVGAVALLVAAVVLPRPAPRR